jgi:hypothetical protein
VKHGHARANKRTAEYLAWSSIVSSCGNPSSASYRRDLFACDRWKNSFENFLSDMGLRPSPHHSIDRIDNAGGYEPENCRWATAIEQARNKTTNRLFTIDGETKCISAWAEIVGIQPESMGYRLRHWPAYRWLSPRRHW